MNRLRTILLLALLCLPALLWAQQAPVEKPTPANTKAATDAVFDDEAYQAGLDTSHVTLDDIMALLKHLIASAIDALNDAIMALYKASPLLYYSLWIALILVLVVLVAHIGTTFASAFRGTAGGQVDPEDEEAERRAALYRDLRDDARRLAGVGSHNEATRTLLMALLALLSEEQVLRVARSWTPRETLARVASKARIDRAGLDTFRAAVEPALYGSQAATREEFLACERILDQLVGTLRGRSV